ncbi:energy transducer TonB [Marinifilum sp. D737]|uniref:energy transducer TonB n=1 Tax=Marinifilum sp. D737 TaxID=2969628 RepID=UPI0022765E49|nr:energy transducer TonB [Marinifilum sp. D737]MCY1633289.1 energy transducer TonB [Marinifilum sp. D737]
MKTTVFLAVLLFLGLFTFGQDLRTNTLEGVNVTPPTFIGSEAVELLKMRNYTTLNDFFTDKIRYPEESEKRLREGTEIIQFTVLPNGSLDDFEVINSISKEIDDEVLRVLKKTDGMWKPGYNNTIPVAMTKEVAIAFRIENSDHLYVARRLFKRGMKSHTIKNKNKRALRLLNRAMVYKPYSEPLIFQRSIVHQKMGNTHDACKDWNRLKALGSSLSDVYLSKFCEAEYAVNIPADTEYITFDIRK